jgi:glutamate 5-kinase
VPRGARTVVVKIGSSSVANARGPKADAVAKLVAEVARLERMGHQVVVVSSGAIATGWAALGGGPRPSDSSLLQAVSAVGQHRLMRCYDEAFAAEGLLCAQVLLAPLDFMHRQQYLHARQTLARLIELGVVPVVNENDATSDDEIRFGDNDRLAALVAHLVSADLLVLLTDAPGLLDVDPRRGGQGSLVEEVVEIDRALEALAGPSGSPFGSGGMVSKLAAAKIASWSGVETVIADARRPGVLEQVLEGAPGVGTRIRALEGRLPARKLWIAFALPPKGTIVVDAGARRALVEREASLLPAGVVAADGAFSEGDAVEIATEGGAVFAKGLARLDAATAAAWAGRRSDELPEGVAPEVVHRDDLVVLPGRPPRVREPIGS